MGKGKRLKNEKKQVEYTQVHTLPLVELMITTVPVLMAVLLDDNSINNIFSAVHDKCIAQGVKEKDFKDALQPLLNTVRKIKLDNAQLQNMPEEAMAKG